MSTSEQERERLERELRAMAEAQKRPPTALKWSQGTAPVEEIAQSIPMLKWSQGTAPVEEIAQSIPITAESLELENLARLAMQEVPTVDEIVRPDDPIISLQIGGTWYRVPESIQTAYEAGELTEAQYMTVAMIETAAQNFHAMHGIDLDESRKLASAAYLEGRIERTHPRAEHEATLPNRHHRRAAIAKDRRKR